MKKVYIALLAIILAVLLAGFSFSLFDKDAAFSVSENRNLSSFPSFTVEKLLNGSFIAELESYYTDTFPFRENILDLNKKLNSFYYYSGLDNSQSVLVIGGNTGAEVGGQSLHETLDIQENPRQDSPIETTDEETPEDDKIEETVPMPIPSEDDVEYCGNVVIVGNRAMEIPTADNEIIGLYAQAVNAISDAVGIRTISILTPNGGEIYSPESMHTGLHSQKDMISLCYSEMNENVLTVDAYSEIVAHANEYIFFRTDHHWTQLGAYYAYKQFCESAGFECVALDSFQTGTYENFVGSMYTFTSGYPQSEMLRNDPDTLTYYLPIVKTTANYYSDSTLSDPINISVIYSKIPETTYNKYLCYIGGDTPVCIIETEAEGGTCIVLKESYGNAFVPFLTSHYSKIVVIDPREFNQSGKPSLDLVEFAKQQGADDLIVINYPYMINSKFYIHLLYRMIGQDHDLS